MKNFAVLSFILLKKIIFFESEVLPIHLLSYLQCIPTLLAYHLYILPLD